MIPFKLIDCYIPQSYVERQPQQSKLLIFQRYYIFKFGMNHQEVSKLMPKMHKLSLDELYSLIDFISSNEMAKPRVYSVYLDMLLQTVQKKHTKIVDKTIEDETYKQNRRFYGSCNTWVKYTQEGIYCDVDLKPYKLTKTPIALVSLSGTSSHWETTGATSIYSLTNEGFRVYLKNATVQLASQYNWTLIYQIISQD